MKTHIYVDGFNLYYRAVKGTKYKWLDLNALCQKLLPKARIERLNYYTARVAARPNDPGQPTRQDTYFRALRTIPHLRIIEGNFISKPARLPLSDNLNKIVSVLRTEEKGSDVNLASHLVHDGHMGEYEQAIVITNDSDLAEPIRIVRDELRLNVGILCPSKYLNPQLKAVITFAKPIRAGVIQASQFPETLLDAVGQFHKPTEWR
ncbi:MAG: NYN domain-containing protein [Acidobacteria bacterium]|nr:NYN domain-containing protein [Acidobacteriota bacterium]